jgi:hypothetical protein
MDLRDSSMKRIRTLRGKRKAKAKGRYSRVKKSDLGKPWARERV